MKGECKWEREKTLEETNGAWNQSLVYIAQRSFLREGTCRCGKIASQKKVNREQDMQIRNHDLRVAHRRRGGAGNTTAASTKWRRIRRTGATGKRRLRRGGALKFHGAVARMH